MSAKKQIIPLPTVVKSTILFFLYVSFFSFAFLSFIFSTYLSLFYYYYLTFYFLFHCPAALSPACVQPLVPVAQLRNDENFSKMDFFNCKYLLKINTLRILNFSFYCHFCKNISCATSMLVGCCAFCPFCQIVSFFADKQCVCIATKVLYCRSSCHQCRR